MKKFAVVLLALVMPVGLANATTTEGAYAGKTEAEVTMHLRDQGYEVRKIDNEDGYLEAYAIADGKRYEIYVDPASGKVVRIVEAD